MRQIDRCRPSEETGLKGVAQVASRRSSHAKRRAHRDPGNGSPRAGQARRGDSCTLRPHKRRFDGYPSSEEEDEIARPAGQRPPRQARLEIEGSRRGGAVEGAFRSQACLRRNHKVVSAEDCAGEWQRHGRVRSVVTRGGFMVRMNDATRPRWVTDSVAADPVMRFATCPS